MSSDCPFQAGPQRVLAPGVALRLLSQKHGESTFQREHGPDSHNPNSHEIDLVSSANGLSFIVEHALPVMRKDVPDPHVLPGEQSGGRAVSLESGNRELSVSEESFNQTLLVLISTHSPHCSTPSGDQDVHG